MRAKTWNWQSHTGCQKIGFLKITLNFLDHYETLPLLRSSDL
jgi:hypothetical protein